MMMEIRGWRDRKIPVSVRENETGAGSIIVVPGLGYTPAHPLLHFSAQLFHAAGFTVFELWWHDTLAGWRDVPHEGASQWLGSDVLAAVEAAGHYGPVAGFVTKSLGTIGLSAAATKRPELRERPAVWLTPILTNHQVVDALADWKAPSLAVIAAGDQVPVGVDLSGSGNSLMPSSWTAPTTPSNATIRSSPSASWKRS